jgi:imidazole glycerol-phosphate synthase subunit HisH
MIGIIDFGMGNLHSVYKAFKRVGADVRVIDSPVGIEKYKKIILPGVGDFKKGMINLETSGFKECIQNHVIGRQIPLLGICLGMQLLTSYSEEGNVQGLGLIDAKTIHFKNLNIPDNLKIPHIGWNNIINCSAKELLKGCENEMVYFVHSYAILSSNSENVICETNYGITFHSGIQKHNIFGLQFHPEKSHRAGLKILKNFVDLKLN